MFLWRHAQQKDTKMISAFRHFFFLPVGAIKIAKYLYRWANKVSPRRHFNRFRSPRSSVAPFRTGTDSKWMERLVDCVDSSRLSIRTYTWNRCQSKSIHHSERCVAIFFFNDSRSVVHNWNGIKWCTPWRNPRQQQQRMKRTKSGTCISCIIRQRCKMKMNRFSGE